MAGIATIERLGDAALLLRFGDGIDPAVNRRVHAWAAALSAQSPDWLIELTPAYASLALHVDVARIGGLFDSDPFDGDPLAVAIAWLNARLRRPLPDSTSSPSAPSGTVFNCSSTTSAPVPDTGNPMGIVVCSAVMSTGTG